MHLCTLVSAEADCPTSILSSVTILHRLLHNMQALGDTIPAVNHD